MGWFGKLTFGSIGMFLGGPLGAIAGAALGHHLVDKGEGDAKPSFQAFRSAEEAPLRRTEGTQAAYFISLFSILGKLSKIDGVVSADEIVVVQNFIDSLPITDREKRFARQVFNEAKDSNYAIEDFASQVYEAIKDQPAVLQSFFGLLFQIAGVDGTLHPNEEAALRGVKGIFRISDLQYNNIKGVYFKDLDNDYKILNCTPNSSNEEIRTNYKKLVKGFHPDRIISKGLPEEFIDFATDRFREIQGAYEKIRQDRNF